MPQLYGWEHITYIAICLVIGATAIICAKLFAKTEKAQVITMRIAGGILLAVIFANRLVLVFERETPNWLKLLTDNFCSTSSYVLGITLLVGKKNNNVLHFIWLIALVGGLATTFAPNFIGQHPSFVYPPTILGLMHHTISVDVVIMMFMFKYIDLTYKKWYCTLWGFASYFSYGAFLICVLGYGNPFYMVSPAIDNTPFTAWVIAPIYIVVYALILLTVELIRRKKKKSPQSKGDSTKATQIHE